ncbi:MAG TPA: hypothetical protein VEK08_11450 [Planctomycetota bacterium]|nr:hypothetical protein [Planctomycetota bacterium]
MGSGLFAASLPLSFLGVRSNNERDRGYGMAILVVAGLIALAMLQSSLFGFVWKFLGGKGVTPFN